MSSSQRFVLGRHGSRNLLLAAAAALVLGCGGATKRTASPQKTGTAVLTGAQIASRFQKVLVAERGAIAMVGRGGCVATITTRPDSKAAHEGSFDEMRVRCPRPERLSAWFDRVDKLAATIPVEPVSEDSEDDKGEEVVLPAASLVTPRGLVVEVKNPSDAARLLSEVHTLSNELASAEVPSPGPRSLGGWQMLHVSGPAHVVFHGSETSGVLDARMSTSGQYLCEFVANHGDSPIRATKSGWISPSDAADAIDEVLKPFTEVDNSEHRSATIAAGITGGTERRANTVSTAAVFVRFAGVQDALGDACLPELEPPTAAASQVRL